MELRKILSESLGIFRNPLTVKVVQSLPSCCLSMRQISNIFRETYSRKPCLCKHWNFKQYAIKVIRMIEKNLTKSLKICVTLVFRNGFQIFSLQTFLFLLSTTINKSSIIFKSHLQNVAILQNTTLFSPWLILW